MGVSPLRVDLEHSRAEARPERRSNARNSQFGASVALSADGNTALIGGDLDSSNGAAWVFTRNGVDLDAAGAKDPRRRRVRQFGHERRTVARRHDRADRGPGRQGPAGEGAVWAFSESASTFVHQGPKLVPSDATSTPPPSGARSPSRPTEAPHSSAAQTTTPARAQPGVYAGAERDLLPAGAAKLRWRETRPIAVLSSAARSPCPPTATPRLIGGPDDNNTRSERAAWIFSRSGATWSQQAEDGPHQRRQRPTLSSARASRCPADGNTALIGAIRTPTWSAPAYLFTRSAGGVASSRD